MVRPSRVSQELRKIASDAASGRRGRTGTRNALRRILAAMGEVKVKLVSTEESEEETADETQFEQHWTIFLADGSKIETVTDVGWGSEPTNIPHGRVEVDVCGHLITVAELLGMIISTGHGPTEDGEEQVLDAEWCSLLAKEGYLD